MATYNHENGMVIPGQTWSIPENYFPGSLGNAKNVRSTEADFRSSFNMTQSGAAVLLNRAVPLSAYPNPTLCGERCSFKPKDTPYLNR